MLDIQFDIDSIEKNTLDKYKEAMLIVDNLECFNEFCDNP